MKLRELLALIRSRKSSSGRFGYGVCFADNYIRGVANAVNAGSFNISHLGKSMSFDFDALIKESAEKLVYSNDEMAVLQKEDSTANFSKILKRGTEAPPNTLMLFRNVITTPKKDRDRDVLETGGAEPDLKMPLLWQHMHPVPIGKMVEVYKHTKTRLEVNTALLDINQVSYDSAKLIEAGVLRISHGFLPKQWEELEDDGDDWSGFRFKEFEIMEESVVSVPSNTDAEILEFATGKSFEREFDALATLYGRDQLKSDLVRAWAGKCYEARNKSISISGAPADMREFLKGNEGDVPGKALQSSSGAAKDADGDGHSGGKDAKPEVSDDTPAGSAGKDATIKAGKKLSAKNKERVDSAMGAFEDIISDDETTRRVATTARSGKAALQELLDDVASDNDSGEESRDVKPGTAAMLLVNSIGKLEKEKLLMVRELIENELQVREADETSKDVDEFLELFSL